MEINIDDILHFDTDKRVLNIDKGALERNGFMLNITNGDEKDVIGSDEKEILMMGKDELLDKLREHMDDCMDVTSVRLLFGDEGTVAAYSNDQFYDPGELVDRISASLRREFDKIVLLKNGKIALYVCENEQIVRKFRNYVRYEMPNHSEYSEMLKQAALELGINICEADELISCGYERERLLITENEEVETTEETPE